MTIKSMLILLLIPVVCLLASARADAADPQTIMFDLGGQTVEKGALDAKVWKEKLNGSMNMDDKTVTAVDYRIARPTNGLWRVAIVPTKYIGTDEEKSRTKYLYFELYEFGPLKDGLPTTITLAQLSASTQPTDREAAGYFRGTPDLPLPILSSLASAVSLALARRGARKRVQESLKTVTEVVA